jgi:hypothetical protein
MTKEIMEQGARQLAVSVGASTRGTALTRILALKTSPGWLVDGTSVTEWRFTGMTEQDGEVYLYGPPVEGTPLTAVIQKPAADALPLLSRMARALALLAERSVPWFSLQTDAVLFTASGATLFLPPAVFQELRDLRPFGENLESYECITHPDLAGEARVSFAVAALLYRVTTGRFPFTGANGEVVHEQARKLAFSAPARLVPGLHPKLSETIMDGLARGRAGQPRLAAWSVLLDGIGRHEIVGEVSEEERARALKDSEAKRAGSEKSFRRRMFWQKNWRLVAIISVVVIAVGAIGGSMLKNALAPRVTRGYSPQKVVETFYTSMNTLDQMTMDACVVNRAGQGEINEVTTLYVTSRVVMGYEGRSNIVSAAEWDKAGRPDIISPASLYGVTGLAIKQEQGEPSPVFVVTYDKWNPIGAPDTGSMPDLNALVYSEGHAVQDRVSLRKDKGDWVIYKIDRVKEELLPAPKVVRAPAAQDATAAPNPLGLQ